MREISYVEATREALTDAMVRDPSVFVFGEGIGARGGNFATTVGLYERFGPRRLRDTPISERGFIGLATGAAMAGGHPVVDFMFVDFILDAMGELINQAAKIHYMSSGRLSVPMVLRGAIGVGNSAATHHSGSYYPTWVNLPGFRVVLASTPYDAKGLFASALRSPDPVLFLEHKSLLYMKGPVPEEEYFIPFGQGHIARAGKDVTVVALSIMVGRALQAAETLSRDGISVEVIDPRTVAPLDIGMILESVHKTGRLLIADENFQPCGIGAEVAAQVADKGFDDLDAPIRRLNGLQTPVPYSPPLEAAVVPNVDTLTQSIRELMAE